MENRTLNALLTALLLIAPAAAGVIEVHQGDTVYQGETADLSLVAGWECTLAYWNSNQNPENELPTRVIDVCENTYKRPITPELFPIGTYYSWSGSWEVHGNNLAFYVRSGNRPLPTPAPKVNTTDQVTEQEKNETVTTKTGLPIKHVADLLIARGDPFTLTLTKNARVWIFGLTDMIPPRQTVNNAVTFTPDETQGLNDGRYGVLIQYPGKNTIYEVTWNETRQELDSPYKTVEPRDMSGLQGSMIQANLRQMINDRENSDDETEVFTMEVQDPEILIAGIDEGGGGNKANLTIRGYTNVKAGSALKFIIDRDKWLPAELKKHTNTTGAEDEGPGNMRDFTVQIPIDYSQLAPGAHFITGITPQGSESTVSFRVYDLPAGQEAPPAHLRYIGGSFEAAELKTDPLVTKTPTPAPTPAPEPTLEIIYITPEPTVTAAGTPVKIVMSAQGDRLEGAEPEPDAGIDGLTLLILIFAAAGILGLGSKMLYSWYRYDDPELPVREIREAIDARITAIRERFSKPKQEAGAP